MATAEISSSLRRPALCTDGVTGTSPASPDGMPGNRWQHRAWSSTSSTRASSCGTQRHRRWVWWPDMSCPAGLSWRNHHLQGIFSPTTVLFLQLVNKGVLAQPQCFGQHLQLHINNPRGVLSAGLRSPWMMRCHQQALGTTKEPTRLQDQ